MINNVAIRKTLRNSLPNLAQSLVNNDYLEANFFYPQYQKYIQKFQSNLPLIQPKDQVIINSLEKQGIYITSLESLDIPNTDKFVNAVNNLMVELTRIAQKSNSKFAIESQFEHLLQYPDIFNWGLEERLINIVTNYLKTPIAYDTFMAHISLNNGRETATRRWHLDNEDRKVIKVIIYFNDVDEDGGPFQYLHPEITSLVLQKVQDKYRFLHHQEIVKLIPNPQTDCLTTYTGKAGTVIIVDTAKSYHRGKPPTQLCRQAVTFGYFSRRPHQPFRAGRNLLSKEQLAHLSTQLSSEKQACIHWQDQLPLLVKWIPKYSYNY